MARRDGPQPPVCPPLNGRPCISMSEAKSRQALLSSPGLTQPPHQPTLPIVSRSPLAPHPPYLLPLSNLAGPYPLLGSLTDHILYLGSSKANILAHPSTRTSLLLNNPRPSQRTPILCTLHCNTPHPPASSHHASVPTHCVSLYHRKPCPFLAACILAPLLSS